MSLPSDDLIQYMQGTGLFDGYTIQYSRWVDTNKPRYLVIIKDGGATAMPWMRSPNYRVILVGNKGENTDGSQGLIGEISEQLVQYIRDNGESPVHQMIECVEPSPPIRTETDRPMISISLMTKLRI